MANTQIENGNTIYSGEALSSINAKLNDAEILHLVIVDTRFALLPVALIQLANGDQVIVDASEQKETPFIPPYDISDDLFAIPFLVALHPGPRNTVSEDEYNPEPLRAAVAAFVTKLETPGSTAA